MAEEIIYIGISKDREEPNVFNPLNRTEAINCIALALCQRYYGCTDCAKCELAAGGDCRLDFMKPQAVTALDALLKGK